MPAWRGEHASFSPVRVGLSGHHIHGERTPPRAPALGLWEGLSWPVPSTHQNCTSLSEEQVQAAVASGRILGPPQGKGRTQWLSQGTAKAWLGTACV